MLKKFFVAVIVTLLVTSAQIAAAEDFDWSKAPRIGNKAELARYIESERRKGNTKIRVILTNGLKVNSSSYFGYLAPCLDIKGNFVNYIDGTVRVNYELKEYPGTRVANAYLSQNQHQAWLELTNEEQKLYNIAVGIVDEANKRSSEMEKARYIHDEICRRVKRYENGKETAKDVLIYGNANCEGYSDAFYMLGRMCGLKVGRIGGQADFGDHAWNWITFADGKSYCVDVTLDDTNSSHEYFLATFEVMKRHHSCEWEIIPNLQ